MRAQNLEAKKKNASEVGSFVSVIIPVFNDAEPLKTCLEALENQTYPKDLYEVIVVDNGSDAAQDIRGVVSRFSQARTIDESFPSSYAARNKGLTQAKGEIIAFTDADCIPASTWIENGVKNLLQVPNCGLVAGKIEVFFKNPQRPTPVELYESIAAFPQKQWLKNRRFGATANIFTSRAVIENVGGFNKQLKSSGDVEWGRRVFDRGYQQVYAEDVCVRHPARHSFKELYKKTIRLAGGSYDLQTLQNPYRVQQKFWFLKELFLDFISPITLGFNVFFKEKLLFSVGRRIQVILVFLYVRYVTACEKMRLKEGVISARK